ncbi:MAG TPA: ribonuclease P protein component [Cytophagales bacterium]|jgi:ribonuclease P protein component|nr:ribonuclease P protein component [Cytophagales bacterium]
MYSLKKTERLTKKKSIQELFERGSSFYLYPFKVFLKEIEGSSENQILISVPKSNFKRAVDRNKIRRRIREGYRLNKTALVHEKKFMIAYIYSIKEILNSERIQQSIVQTLNKITEKR